MSVGKHCHGTVCWVEMPTGRFLAVEPVPSEFGRVLAKHIGKKLVGYVESQDRPAQPGHTRYVAHRAACNPDAPRIPRSQLPPALIDQGAP